MKFEFRLDRASDDLMVVTLSGSMTMSPALDQLTELMRGLLVSQSPRYMVFDMTGVDYLDSTGLGFLVRTNRELEKCDGMVRLCGTGERVRALMAMTRTNTLIRMDDSRTESIAALNS